MRARPLFLGLFPSIGIAWNIKAPTATVATPTRSFSLMVEVTEAPAVHPDLLRRDLSTGTRTAFLGQSNVCGFLNANSNSGIGCNVGYVATCGLFVDNFSGAPASEGAMGCCYPSTQGQTTSNCAAFTACLDYSMITSADSCANICGPNENTLQCTDSNTAYCTSFTFSNVFTDAAAGINFVGYQCVASPGGIAQGAYTTFAGQTIAANFSTTTVLVLEEVTRNISSTGSSATLSTTSSTGSSTTLSATSSTNSPTTSSTSPATSSSSLIGSAVTGASPTSSPPAASSTVPAGAIAGGVVGGVAVIALVAAGIFFWGKRHRRHEIAELHGAQPVQDYNGYFSMQQQKAPAAEVAGDSSIYEMMSTPVHR